MYALEGELVLAENFGDSVLRLGDSTGWPAGIPDGPHLQNRSETDARFLVVGTRNNEDRGEYSDIDLQSSTGVIYSSKTHRQRTMPAISAVAPTTD